MNERSKISLEMQSPVIRAARTAIASAAGHPLGTWLIVGLGAGVFLALVGALQSYQYQISTRLGFWLTLCLIGAALAAGIEYLLHKTPLRSARPYQRWVALILVFSVVMTPVAFLGNSLGGLRPWSELPMFFRNSLVISTAFVVFRQLLGELYRSRADSAGTEAVPADGAAFMNRLPVELRNANLRAIRADGHYLRVLTDRGSDLVLFRMKDAVRELRGTDGMRVHRGWWVSRAAVTGALRRNGRLVLMLQGDLEVPVSRPNVKTLKQAGWL